MCLCHIHHTTPNTTVALKLTSFPAGITTETGCPSASTSRYSSVRSELDFHPQLWLTANVSGALVKRVRLAPVALAHAIVKYALTTGRGSRYGCTGVAGGAVAGNMTVLPPRLVVWACADIGVRSAAGVPGVGCVGD